MAKWKVRPETVNNSLYGEFDYTDNESRWRVYQDETPFIEQAKLDREQQSSKDVGYKKFATIPDIVAIEIKEQHGIDIHAVDFMDDKDKLAKFMVIIRQDYPYLLSH